MCFTAPPRRLKGLCQVFPHINRLARASQDFHSRENCFLDLSWHITALARGLKQLSQTFSVFKPACTCLTGPLLLSRSFLAVGGVSIITFISVTNEGANVVNVRIEINESH